MVWAVAAWHPQRARYRLRWTGIRGVDRWQCGIRSLHLYFLHRVSRPVRESVVSRSRIHAIELPEGDHLGDTSVSTDGETHVTTDGFVATVVVLLTGTIPTKPWSPRSLLKASREPRGSQVRSLMTPCLVANSSWAGRVPSRGEVR